jgi:leucyl/phenylalanyl-tRNA--protein transferase
MTPVIQFPDPNDSDEEGLVAVGGELSSDFLIAAYSQGLFPWFNEGEPILWWSPDPRMILDPRKFKCSSSLRQTLNSGKFDVRADTDFSAVIEMCAGVKRPRQNGSWITPEMKEAYIRLHNQGVAHSIEAYCEGKLAGGLYGISLGNAFFGESMFFTVRDASKVALYYLCRQLVRWNFSFIDVQQSTPHLRSLGAIDMDRSEFLKELGNSLLYKGKKGKWRLDV